MKKKSFVFYQNLIFRIIYIILKINLKKTATKLITNIKVLYLNNIRAFLNNKKTFENNNSQRFLIRKYVRIL